MIVSGKNKANRPYFFTAPNGERVEFPSMASGSGELEGAQLDEFNALVKMGLIEAEADAPKAKPKAEDPADELEALQAEYAELAGKNADKRWQAERLTAEIEKLKAAD